MVVRQEKRNRKYLGTRRWGKGNIKNARGKGDKGGVGKGGKKHKWTWVTAKAPETIRTIGFKPWRPRKPKEINLRIINELVIKSKEAKATIELKNYKVLSNGSLSKPAIIRASSFSKSALEKIKSAGGEAIKI
ncbi:MAG: uL15m family ribosomal protein [Candidatus Micrarchaeaceae archaeon]|jgi:large subunit ribosomal protein L15